MFGKKRSSKTAPTSSPPTTSSPAPELEMAPEAELDPALFEAELATTAIATAGPPPGGDPDAHAALVAALSSETPEFALTVFEEAAEDRRAAVAAAILDAFGPDEGAAIVAEAYGKAGEPVPDLSAAAPLVAEDLALLDETETETEAEAEAAPTLSPALDAALATWRPALAKVTDPVAFMSDASYTNAIKHGSKTKTGFYTKALAELETLRDGLDALTLDLAITPFESAELCRIADVATAWIHLYETLRDTGDRPRDRDSLTDEVLAVVDLVQGKLDGLAGAVLGLETLTRLDASLKDVRTFVSAWAVLASDETSSCSKPMWAAFLQTNQRYRMILNHYGLLDERGGEKAQYNLAVRNMAGTVKTEEELRKESDEAGGFMVLAMETYSYKAGDHAKMLVQIDEILDRVFAGEFETMQGAVQAARKHVGGGGASDNFYESLTAKIEAAWMAVAAGEDTAAGSVATSNMLDADTQAQVKATQAYGKGTVMVGKQVESHGAAEDGMKERSEVAWQQYENYRAKADFLQREAQAWLDKGDGYELQAAQAFASAQAWLEKARERMGDVDVERWPILQDGLAKVEGKLDDTEAQFDKQSEIFKNAQDLRTKVRASVNQNQAFLDTYDPEQVEVEVPDGLKGLETKTYGRLALSVDARIPGTPIWLGGGASTEFGILQKGGANWGYNKNDWNLRATLDLVLLKITGAYVAGSYVEARDKLTPLEVIAAGEEERARYAAMKDIASKKPEVGLAAAQNQAAKALHTTFGELKDEAKRLKSGLTTRSEWQTKVMLRAIDAKKAQGVLMGGTFEVFNSITDLTDAFALALMFPSPDSVYNAVFELRDVDEEAAESEVEAQRDSVLDKNAEPVEKTNKELAKIANYSNNKDVYFEDYGGWEWGVEVGTSSHNASFTMRHVTVTSNGRGEKYDFDEVQRKTMTGGVTVGDYSGEISAEWDDDELAKISISGSMVISNGEFTEGKRKELCEHGKAFDEALKNGLLAGPQGGGTALLKGIIAQFKSSWMNPIKDLAKPKPFGIKMSGETTVKIGYDWTPGGSSLIFGQGHVAKEDLQVGMFKASASAEIGQEVTIPL